MPQEQRATLVTNGPEQVCPECGATVQVLRGRWLVLHREGVAGYDYPAMGRRRCPGSLLSVRAETPDREQAPPAVC